VIYPQLRGWFSAENLSRFSFHYASSLPCFGTPVANKKASELTPQIAASKRFTRRSRD
jgi:hypothetical protein